MRFPSVKFGFWWRWALLLGLTMVVLFVPIPTFASNPTERTFIINASRFEYTPAEIRVNPGDIVTLAVVATDVVHGLSIDGYNLATTADPGQTARLTFIANHQGTYRFHCTITCGNLHPFMTGKLVVGQNVIFWRAISLVGLAIFAGAWMGKK